MRQYWSIHGIAVAICIDSYWHELYCHQYPQSYSSHSCVPGHRTAISLCIVLVTDDKTNQLRNQASQLTYYPHNNLRQKHPEKQQLQLIVTSFRLDMDFKIHLDGIWADTVSLKLNLYYHRVVCWFHHYYEATASSTVLCNFVFLWKQYFLSTH